VDCPPGTLYGRYFHLLLHSRGLLLLGLYRVVQQDGFCFRATLTNPSYVSAGLKRVLLFATLASPRRS
jgi:hypothetical protein